MAVYHMAIPDIFRSNRPPSNFLLDILEREELPDECLIWKFNTSNSGYGKISINSKTYLVHRVVLEKTQGPSPTGKPWALHTCPSGDNPLCCNPKHLRWGAPKDNSKDRVRNGTTICGTDHKCAKLTEEQVREIFTAQVGGRKLAKQYGVSKSMVYSIKNGKRWAHVTDGLEVGFASGKRS